MLRWPHLAAALLIAAAPFAATADPGDVFYVNAASPAESPDGLSWTTAYRTLAEGIERARASFGGEVWVAEGVYNELRASEGGALFLQPGVDLYGGFEGTEELRQLRDPLLHPTVIDGSAANGGQPAAPVVFGANNVIIDGFTIRGGRGEVGPGMIINEVSPRIVDCVFTDNAATGFGGAVITIGAASPRFVGCVFTNNTAARSGGAVTNSGATPLFEDCLFSLNEATEAGGAVFNTPGSDVTIEVCTFERNKSGAGGGAIFNEGASPYIAGSIFLRNASDSFGGALFNNRAADAGPSDVLAINCVFAKNTAAEGGGAISTLGSTFTAVNCTIADNTAPEESGGAFFNNDATTEVLNSIIWYNSDEWIVNLLSFTEIRWSNVGGGDRGPNNIAAEPRFANRAGDDYSLLPQSPSIDAGTAAGAPRVDILGTARPQFDAVDQGAYESRDRALPDGGCHGHGGSDTTADGLTLLAAGALLAAFRRAGVRRR